MHTDIDDLIRDAVRRQEELAPDPERIRAALPGRSARRRSQHRTMALAAAAVAVAAVAVTVPTVVLRDPARPVTPPATSVTDTTTPSPAPGMAAAPLRYRPTWLPDGMVPRVREAPISDTADPKVTTVQLWSSTPIDTGAVLDAHIGLYSWRSDAEAFVPAPPNNAGGEGGQPDTAGREVDINGRPAYVDSQTVTWQVDDHTKLMLVSPGMNLPEEDLVRIARSVRPDTTQLFSPLRADRLPAGLTPESVAVTGNSAQDWLATLLAVGAQSYVAVSAGTPDDTAAEGETLTVGGHTAHLAQVDREEPARPTYRAQWVLTVDLGEDRVLTVRGGTKQRGDTSPLTREDIIAVAEHVVLDPNPDLDWLGR